MGLFSTECKHCGSKEHSSSDCPHGIFSSKCKHCGSVEHSSSDCPHGIFSSKCKHCGSVDHSSDNCPQGIFSSKCKHCGSTEHSSSDCPHGIFSSECKHCGSVNHSSNDCPQGIFATRKKSSSNNSSVPQDEVSTIFFFVKWGIIIAVALFVIMVAVFLAPLILLIWYLIKKREMQWVAILGMVFSAYLIYDITSGGFITSSMMKMQRTGEEKYLALGYFVVLATTLGFFIDKYTSMKIPISESGNFFEQKSIKERRPFIAGFSVLLLTIFSIFQFVSFSGNSSGNSFNNSNVINTNNNSTYSTNTNSSFNNNLLVGNWNISNQNNSSYTFSNNGRGNFTNSNRKRFDFDWSIQNSNTLKIKLDVDNSLWNWNIESFTANKIVMYSQQHNERRTITKGNSNINSGTINGTNVIIRNGHSTQSKIIGSFKNSGEKVIILDNFYPNNNGETLIQREINVRTNIGTNYNLQKGKSVTILSRQNGNVKIQFKDRELRNLTTTINESYLDKSVSSKWYKVERNSGEIGWVFGKFINI